MSASNYDKFINEAAYKNAIHNTPNTSSKLAWYEETGKAVPRLDAQYIWQDSKYIPDEPEDGVEEYTVKIGQESVVIYKHYKDLELTEVENVSGTFYNEKFNQIIIDENYLVTLKDANDKKVPFGLNKWTYDSNNGYLSFIDGTPDGYEGPFKVTFYRYEGRMLEDSTLTRDGSVQMVPEYYPEENQDIATKKYVDANLGNTNQTVNKLLPPTPETIEGKALTVEANSFPAYDVKTNDHVDIVVLPSAEIKVTTPRFYNPEVGTVEFLINDYAFKIIDLSNPTDSGELKITFNDDYYKETLASRGFFKGLAFEVTFKPEELSVFYTQYHYLNIKVRYNNNIKSVDSETIKIGIEPEQKTSTLKNEIEIATGDNFEWGYVSGVPTPRAGSILKLKKIETETLQVFKSGERIANLSAIEQNIDIIPDTVYSNYNPTVELTGEITVPENLYQESLNVSGNSYNIFSENNGEYSRDYNFRIDTVSDEDYRCTSGTDSNSGPEDYGSVWDNTKDLTSTEELMMVNGLWQWPTQDFTVNGTKINTLTDWNATWIKAGPDYSKCAKSGKRFATFKYSIPWSNGVYIEIPGISQNKDTKVPKVYSFQIKVAGSTGWLDCKVPYRGIGTVVADGAGCLAVQDSTEGKIYCTFGPKPVKGTLYVRIGMTYSDLCFGTPKVTSNI